MKTIQYLATGILVFASSVRAGTHTITFDNRCGHGVPTLIQGNNVLSTGQSYTSNGDFASAIAYLNNSQCSFNGEHCTTVEITLNSGFSSGDITLIPTHSFSDGAGWEFTNGCDGQGAFCNNKGCKTAFYVPTDNCVQVGCPSPDVGMNIIFCEGGGDRFIRDPNDKTQCTVNPT